MIPAPANTRVWLVAGVTDLRTVSGSGGVGWFDAQAELVRRTSVHVPRPKGDLVKLIHWDGQVFVC